MSRVDNYFITIDRPCNVCVEKRDHNCPACDGMGRVKEEMKFSHLVKRALTDLGTIPPPCSDCAKLRREMANLIQLLARNPTEEHDLTNLFLDRDGIGARIFKSEDG